MLKLEENLESIYLDWSDWQSGRRVRSSGKGREMEKIKRIVGPSPSSRSGSLKILTCPFRNHSWNVETITQPCPGHAHKNSWRPVTALPPKTRDFPMVLPPEITCVSVSTLTLALSKEVTSLRSGLGKGCWEMVSEKERGVYLLTVQVLGHLK